MFRELSGCRDALPELREACLSALKDLVAQHPERVIVLGGAAATRAWDSRLLPEVRRFGAGGAAEPPGLPLSLGVGVRLLNSVGWNGEVTLYGIAWDAPVSEVDGVAEWLAAHNGPAGLLVLADGSARRGEHAPGSLDRRSFAFDAETSAALREGDVEGLLAIDPALANELMAGGRSALQVLASVVRDQASTPEPTLVYEDDPLGVMYHVATWRLS